MTGRTVMLSTVLKKEQIYGEELCFRCVGYQLPAGHLQGDIMGRITPLK